MDHTTPTKDEIQLLMKTVVLENNEKINKAIEAMGDKVTQAVSVTTQTFLTELMKVATEHGKTQVKLAAVESKVSNIWGKFIGIGTSIAVLSALATYLLTKG